MYIHIHMFVCVCVCVCVIYVSICIRMCKYIYIYTVASLFKTLGLIKKTTLWVHARYDPQLVDALPMKLFRCGFLRCTAWDKREIFFVAKIQLQCTLELFSLSPKWPAFFPKSSIRISVTSYHLRLKQGAVELSAGGGYEDQKIGVCRTASVSSKSSIKT